MEAKNVLGEALAPCCTRPMTGFFRNGRCETDERDVGRHVVCAEMTEAFLAFTKARGNDLSMPVSELGFPGSGLATAGACAPPAGRRRPRPG